MAIDAAAAQVHPSPPQPARRTVAWLQCTHLAWSAVICLLLASLWLYLGCVVTTAYKVVYVAMVTLMLVLPVSLLGALMMSCAKAAAAVPVAAAATDIEAPKVRKGNNSAFWIHFFRRGDANRIGAI
jgi:hypothetical protein